MCPASGGWARLSCRRAVISIPSSSSSSSSAFSRKTWLNACRFDEVERVGDYVDFEICGQSIVVLRTEHGLKAYFNACRHRGTAAGERAGPDRRVSLSVSCAGAGTSTVHLSSRPTPTTSSLVRRGQLCLPEVRIGDLGRMGLHQHGPAAEPLHDFLDPHARDGWRASSSRTCAWLGTSRPSSRPTGRRLSTPSSRAGMYRAPIHRCCGPTSTRARPPSPSPRSTGPPSTSSSAALPPRRPLPVRARRRRGASSEPPTASIRRPSTGTSSTPSASSAPCTSSPTWPRRPSCARPRGPTALTGTSSTNGCGKNTPAPWASTTPMSPSSS